MRTRLRVDTEASLTYTVACVQTHAPARGEAAAVHEISWFRRPKCKEFGESRPTFFFAQRRENARIACEPIHCVLCPYFRRRRQRCWGASIDLSRGLSAGHRTRAEIAMLEPAVHAQERCEKMQGGYGVAYAKEHTGRRRDRVGTRDLWCVLHPKVLETDEIHQSVCLGGAERP